MAHSKESFSADEGVLLQRAVAVTLGVPLSDVTVAQSQEWRSKVVVELHVNVRNPRVAEAAIATLSASNFASRVANAVGTKIGGAPLSGLQVRELGRLQHRFDLAAVADDSVVCGAPFAHVPPPFFFPAHLLTALSFGRSSHDRR